MNDCIHGIAEKECGFCWHKDQFEICNSCSLRYDDPENKLSIKNTNLCIECSKAEPDIDMECDKDAEFKYEEEK